VKFLPVKKQKTPGTLRTSGNSVTAVITDYPVFLEFSFFLLDISTTVPSFIVTS
jgi:hypothetical protein